MFFEDYYVELQISHGNAYYAGPASFNIFFEDYYVELQNMPKANLA